MHQLVLEQDKKYRKKNLPTLKSGQTVRVHERIQEGGKFRTQMFEGLVIRCHLRTNLNATITVRKIVDGIGVEKIYMIHSPNVQKIDIVRESKVRQANILYIRKLSGKSARLKSTFASLVQAEHGNIAEEEAAVAEPVETETIEKESPAEKVEAVAEETSAEAPSETTPEKTGEK